MTDILSGHLPDYQLSPNHDLIYYATVPSGFEEFLEKEILSSIPDSKLVQTERGKIFFKANLSDLNLIHKLRCAGHVYLLLFNQHFKNSKNCVWDKSFDDIDEYVRQVSIENLNYTFIKQIWLENLEFQGRAYVEDPNYEKDEEGKLTYNFNSLGSGSGFDGSGSLEMSNLEKKAVDRYMMDKLSKENYKNFYQEPYDKNNFTFKVEGTRCGKKQNITSAKMCQVLGGHIYDATEIKGCQWPFKMVKPSCRIIHYIGKSDFRISFELSNKTGLYNRNITFFGKTPTKNSIVAGMVRMADIKPFEVVYDPMCGVGSIPIEVATDFSIRPMPLVLGSDIFTPCMNSFVGNLASFNKSNSALTNISPFLADATEIPIKTNSIDVIITDMPFGKRIGSKKSNREIFIPFFHHLARIVRHKGGRAVIMTTDRNGVKQGIENKLNGKYWSFEDFKCVNHGNLKVAVYLLKRSWREFRP